MLTLLPFSGLQDAFKRRNSKTMDQFTDRRGSISVYDTYSLPSSKAAMRRFSSYDQLAPFFQQILSSQEANNSTPAAPEPTPAPVSPSTSTSNSGSPAPLLRSRRGSVTRFANALTGSFRRQKTRETKSESESEISCNDLDAQIAKIKNQLAQFKSEDIDMSQRVEDLSSSVEELSHNTVLPEHNSLITPQDHLYFRLRQEKMQMQRSMSFQHCRPSTSTTGLHSISESINESSDSEFDDEDDQITFSCKRGSPLTTRRSRPSSYVSISEEPEAAGVDDDSNTKEYCILNNTFTPNTVRGRAKSMSQLPNMIRNDLTRSETSSKRLSVVSDSVLITQQHLPALRWHRKEHEF